jgi:TolB protein
VCLAILGGLWAAPAGAAFPGTNGRIAFATDLHGDLEIYTMNPDGTGQVRLTNHPATDRAPAWHPSAPKIAFSTDRDGDVEIYVMNADGSGQTR